MKSALLQVEENKGETEREYGGQNVKTSLQIKSKIIKKTKKCRLKGNT